MSIFLRGSFAGRITIQSILPKELRIVRKMRFVVRSRKRTVDTQNENCILIPVIRVTMLYSIQTIIQP